MAAGDAGTKGWGQLSIQSKLVAMLLATSIVTALVVGFVAYYAGSSALERSAFDQLTSIRESRDREINSYMDLLQDAQVLLSRGRTTIEAVRELSAAFAELEDETVTAEEQAELDEWYGEFWLPSLEDNYGSPIDPISLTRMDGAQRYLQANWTAAQRNYDVAISVSRMPDGSTWSDVHGTYHSFFREITVRFDYEDVLLLDTEGNIIYSAYKGFDLGVNVRTGILANTVLSRAYDEAISSNSANYVVLTDFERHPPPYGEPQMWTVSPVGDDGEIIGALALKIPRDTINGIMTHDERWVEEGLGETGETYLVGRSPDGEVLMRSNSRFLIDNPETYAEKVMTAGTPQAAAEKAVRVGATGLIQPVETVASREALGGQTDTTTAEDYRGERVLTAYAPLDIAGLHWAIIAEIDETEAFAPVRNFARNVALSTAGIVLAVALASMLLARLFSRPIRSLVDGVRKVSSGEADVRVEATSADEFADLADAFNEMNRSLTDKNAEIGEQRAEYATLVSSIMPEELSHRFRAGEEIIAKDHPSVTVILLELLGFEEYSSDLSSEQAVAAMNGLYQAFDDAATTHGVELVRADRHGYVATCGMVVPRIDHCRRAVACAQEFAEALSAFNARRGTTLGLRAGLDTGEVSSGLLGHAHTFDIWGRTVARAVRTRDATGDPGVYVTQDVYERAAGSGQVFDEVGRIDTADGATALWRVRVGEDVPQEGLTTQEVGDG